MKFQKTYELINWVDWHHSIFESLEDFYNTFSFYPNILEANKHTFSQFDFLVNVVPGEDLKVKRIENEFTSNKSREEIRLASFKTEKCSIDFAVDEIIEDKKFILIYDSDPEWDDGDDKIIDVPIDTNKKIYQKV